MSIKQTSSAVEQFERNVEAGIPAAVVIRPEAKTTYRQSKVGFRVCAHCGKNRDQHDFGNGGACPSVADEAQAMNIQAIVDEAISADTNMSAAELLDELTDYQIADGIIEDWPGIELPERADVVAAVAKFRASFVPDTELHTYLVVGVYNDGTRWADSYEAVDTDKAEEMAKEAYPEVEIAGVVELQDGKMVVVA